MASRRQRNEVWEDEKPKSLTEWLAGRNMRTRKHKKTQPKPTEITAIDLAAAILARLPVNGLQELNEVRAIATPSSVETPKLDTTTVSIPRTGSSNPVNVRREIEDKKVVATTGNNAPGPSTLQPNNQPSGKSHVRGQSIQAHPGICTAKMGSEIGDPASIGDCTCTNCAEDRSAVQRALRVSRLERELRNIKMDERAESAARDIKTTDDTNAAAVEPRKLQRRASFSVTISTGSPSSCGSDESGSDSDLSPSECKFRKADKQDNFRHNVSGHACRFEHQHGHPGVMKKNAKPETGEPTTMNSKKSNGMPLNPCRPLLMPALGFETHPVHNSDLYIDLNHVPAAPVYFRAPVSAPVYYPAGAGSHSMSETRTLEEMSDCLPNRFRTASPGLQTSRVEANVPPRRNLSAGPSARPRGPPPRRAQNTSAYGPPPGRRAPPSTQPSTLRSVMRDARVQMASQVMPYGSVSFPTLSSVSEMSADRWDRLPEADPSEIYPPLNTVDEWQRQRMMAHIFRFDTPLMKLDDDRFLSGCHRDLAYPPGFSASEREWRSGGSDLDGYEEYASHGHPGSDPRRSASKSNHKRCFSIQRAWFQPSDSGSSDCTPDSIVQNYSASYHGPGYANPRQHRNGHGSSLPPWADISAAQSSEDPPCYDAQHGRHAPYHVNW